MDGMNDYNQQNQFNNQNVNTSGGYNQNYNQGYNQGYNNSNMNYNNVPGNVDGYTLWLVLGIIQIASCCCCNCVMFITGIITVVMVTGANKAFKSGDMFTANKKMKTAKIVCLIGFVIGFGSTIIGAVGGFFQGFFNELQYQIDSF